MLRASLKIFLCSCLVLSLFRPDLIRAEDEKDKGDLTGLDIANKSNDRYVAHDEATELWMLLINNRNEIRKRRFMRFRKDFKGHKRVFMKFLYPEDVRNTGILNVERPKEKYDNQFLYLPAIRKLRRMSSADKSQRWVGSDFFYEDMQEVKMNQWTFNRLPDEIYNDVDCFVVEWMPKPDGDTVYGKQIYWYGKDDYGPRRIDYYDKKLKLWKRVHSSDTEILQGVWTPWKIIMEDFQAKHRTEVYRRWMFYDTNVPDGYFTSRSIQKKVSTYDHPPGLWDIIESPGKYDDTVAQITGK
ncbi:outer membrane lipoprotein-sorting protein [Candidatus Omnitrophota bacterium]